jgi:hypothetical protein
LSNHHPQAANPNSILLCGFCKGLNGAISEVSLNRIYHIYKKEFFPKLVDNPNILPEDKQKIRELLKKPCNHYIIRHSSLTEKSTILNEYTLRQFAGWHVLILLKLEYSNAVLTYSVVALAVPIGWLGLRKIARTKL